MQYTVLLAMLDGWRPETESLAVKVSFQFLHFLLAGSMRQHAVLSLVERKVLAVFFGLDLIIWTTPIWNTLIRGVLPPSLQKIMLSQWTRYVEDQNLGSPNLIVIPHS